MLLFISSFATIVFLASFQTKEQKKQEAIILAKVHALPEVKEWFKTAKKSKPALEIGEPTLQRKFYSIQVGISNMDMFRTSYYLFVDPKTYKIYFWDQLDSANSNITLKQWRYWRTKPGWNEMHYYKAGKLVVLGK